jgi:hypothetical protein
MSNSNHNRKTGSLLPRSEQLATTHSPTPNDGRTGRGIDPTEDGQERMVPLDRFAYDTTVWLLTLWHIEIPSYLD